MTKRIEEIDRNFAAGAMSRQEKMTFYDACSAKFFLSGVFHDKVFRRMPKEVAERISEGVAILHTNTAGGSVHFRTDSAKIAIRCKMEGGEDFPHMPATGARGFDLYADGVFAGIFLPPKQPGDAYEAVLSVRGEGVREIGINFPLYHDVTRLEIGVCDGARVEAYSPYRSAKPVVYYGSSITQGGCASRPGMAYPAILERKLGYPTINLGFSGSAHGERTMADYIASLSMKAFVLDYDHNAASVEELRKTHEPFFDRIRNAQPELPIVMLCQHNPYLDRAEERRRVVWDTYCHGMANGDRKVFWVDGFDLFPHRDATVDGCHPTDYGFALMAEKIGKVLGEALESCEQNEKSKSV